MSIFKTLSSIAIDEDRKNAQDNLFMMLSQFPDEYTGPENVLNKMCLIDDIVRSYLKEPDMCASYE
jgi:hypothetical protein